MYKAYFSMGWMERGGLGRVQRRAFQGTEKDHAKSLKQEHLRNPVGGL